MTMASVSCARFVVFKNSTPITRGRCSRRRFVLGLASPCLHPHGGHRTPGRRRGVASVNLEAGHLGGRSHLTVRESHSRRRQRCTERCESSSVLAFDRRGENDRPPLELHLCDV